MSAPHPGPRWGRESLTLVTRAQPMLTNVSAGQRPDSTKAAQQSPRDKFPETAFGTMRSAGQRSVSLDAHHTQPE
jgi:hypothetical protein